MTYLQALVLSDALTQFIENAAETDEGPTPHERLLLGEAERLLGAADMTLAAMAGQ